MYKNIVFLFVILAVVTIHRTQAGGSGCSCAEEYDRYSGKTCCAESCCAPGYKCDDDGKGVKRCHSPPTGHGPDQKNERPEMGETIIKMIKDALEEW